jgi:hypothetical protein
MSQFVSTGPSLRCHYDVMELDRKTTSDEVSDHIIE